MKNTQLYTFLICVVIITIPSILPWSSLSIGNTTIWWVLYALTLIMIMALKKPYFNVIDDKTIWPIKLYLFWNIISIIRGAFVADNYWEWKALIDVTMFFILPIIIYVSTNKLLVQKIVSFWLKYALPAFFIFLPFFTLADATGGYLIPIMFLLLFLPVLPLKWKIIVLFFTLMVFLAGLDARSNIIKYSLSLILGLSFNFRRFIKLWMFKFVHAIFLALPFVLLVLGLTDIFNVFKMDEYINHGNQEYNVKVNNFGDVEEVDLMADSRTFLYAEVISSAINNNYIYFGRTPARGYDSEFFGEQNFEYTGKLERQASEVSILNLFTWTGLVGVILYSIVFFRASVLAIYRSNSYFMKIIGLFVAFRWIYAFVEDFTNFDLSYIFLLMTIAMCYSKEFREMTNSEFTLWINGIVSKRFRTQTQNLIISGSRISNPLIH